MYEIAIISQKEIYETHCFHENGYIKSLLLSHRIAKMPTSVRGGTARRLPSRLSQLISLAWGSSGLHGVHMSWSITAGSLCDGAETFLETNILNVLESYS